MQKEEKEKKKEKKEEKKKTGRARIGKSRKSLRQFCYSMIIAESIWQFFVLFRRAPPSRPGFHSRNVNTLRQTLDGFVWHLLLLSEGKGTERDGKEGNERKGKRSNETGK